jgi:hypothetical protein
MGPVSLDPHQHLHSRRGMLNASDAAMDRAGDGGGRSRCCRGELPDASLCPPAGLAVSTAALLAGLPVRGPPGDWAGIGWTGSKVTSLDRELVEMLPWSGQPGEREAIEELVKECGHSWGPKS